MIDLSNPLVHIATRCYSGEGKGWFGKSKEDNEKRKKVRKNNRKKNKISKESRKKNRK